MPSPKDLLMKMIQNNPAIANNPQAQEWIQVIQSGDSARGEEIANNLLNSMGMTKDQAKQQISQRFGIPM